MPSGPKKRRAAKRRKQKMAISDSQSNSNSNPEPSPKEVEDENEEVFRTPTSEPEIPLSESDSVYYSVEVKNHSRRGSSDDFKSLDFDDNTQERLNEFQLEEKDNSNVNFDDRGSRAEEFQNHREEPEEIKLNKYTYVSEEELRASEQNMSSDNKNAKVLPWLGEAICTEDILNVNGSIDEASKELHVSADDKSGKVDLDMALENREITQDRITNVMEKLDDEKDISLTAQSDSPDKNFVEVIGFSHVNVNYEEAGSWLDKEEQNIDSDENRDSKAELHRELPIVYGNYIDLDLSGSAKDKCIEDTKLDEFLHVNDNKSTTDENKLQIEVGQQIIEKSVPFDEKTALKALAETAVVSTSKESEVKVVPWLYNDIPTEYVDVNVDVEVLHPEKEIAGLDGTETFNFCHEYDVSKCTPFESLDQPIQHSISNPKIPKGVLEVQRMLLQTDVELISNEHENFTEKGLGRENQQSINSNESPKDLSGVQEMHPKIEADLVSNELGKSNEKNSRRADSSILVCDVKSVYEEDILSPRKSYKDSVQKFNTENPKNSTEIQEIPPLTYVELISDELGKSAEKSPVLVESSIPICEEEGLNMIATENSAKQEEDVLSPIEISKDSVNTVNTEKPKDSSVVQEILPLTESTDVELISSDFCKPVEKSLRLDESSILTCEEEGLNVTAIENSVEEEENTPFMESPKDSGNIYSTENSKDSADVQEIAPQTEVELISNDLGKSVEKSSESSSLICEEEGLNVIATENLVEQEEDILTVTESAKESAHTNQEIHHHTDVVSNNDELHKTTENSSKYVENLTGEKEGLPIINVEKLNKEIHIDTASSIDMAQEKPISDSVNNQSDETVDKCAGLDENYILNPEGMNQNGHDYLESLIGSNSVSSQPSMKESPEFSSNSEHTENIKKIEVASKAVRPRTTIWNCCGLLEAFTSSDR